MKKRLLGFIPLFILLFFSSNHISTIRSDFNIPTGASYTYDVINSYWNITQGVNIGEGFGFNFEGTSYNITTPVVTKTRMVNPQNITYTITVGSTTIEAYDTSLELVSWLIFMQYPILKAQVSLSPWNQIEVEKGPLLFRQFFVEPTTFSDAFILLSNDSFVSEQFTNNKLIVKQIHGHFDNSSSVSIFDWMLNIRYYDHNVNTDFTGAFYLQLAYHKYQGQLMGFRVEMKYHGIIFGVSYSIDWKQKIEIVGYNLPTLYFKSETPLFKSPEWVYFFIPIIYSLIYTIKKRKTKVF